MLRTPLQHSDGEALGNVRLFRSQKTVCADGVVRRMPVYSGNAFRGMLRDIAARQLMEALEVELPPAVFHFLTSGGSLTSGPGDKSIDVDQARRLRGIIPMVGIWGGGVGSQILEGKLTILPMTPICREVLHLLPAYCRDAPTASASIRDLRHMEFGTRRDDAKLEKNQRYLADPAASVSRSPDGVSTSMIYENETLIAGTCMRFGFRLRGATEREWTCFASALIGWLAEPYLGARSAAGYGEVAAPTLYRGTQRLDFHQRPDEGSIVDLTQPLATVESHVDTSERLEMAADAITEAYRVDVQARRTELIQALGSIG